MYRGGALIPAFPTLSPLALLGHRDVDWRQWFPFSSRVGNWTFSGRVALYHGLRSLKLPENSTILVPAYHQGVEIETLLVAGYRVRYYRVTEQLFIDLADVERRLDDSVSALFVIHYFGFSQPLDLIRRFCEEHRVKLIEDCALSLFSRDNGTWLGSVGDLALFSVYKTLALPHGGFLLTKAERPMDGVHPAPLTSTLVQTLDLLHQGLRASGWEHIERWVTGATRCVARTIGWNRDRTIASGIAHWDPRLLAYGASSWVVRLMGLVDPAEVVTRRRRNFARLASRLRDHISCPFPELPSGTCPLFFPVMVRDKIQFQRELARSGVQSVNVWWESHPTCPPELASEVSGWRRHCLELPIHQGLTAEDIDRVADVVLSVLSEQKAKDS